MGRPSLSEKEKAWARAALVVWLGISFNRPTPTGGERLRLAVRGNQSARLVRCCLPLWHAMGRNWACFWSHDGSLGVHVLAYEKESTTVCVKEILWYFHLSKRAQAALVVWLGVILVAGRRRKSKHSFAICLLDTRWVGNWVFFFGATKEALASKF